MTEVSADKAYLGHANLAAIEAAGAVPYVPFKTNSRPAGSAAWRRMWAVFLYRQDDFLAHYHKRSNVESTFSAIKRKFGGSVRSKRFTAQVNEVLCKVLCHNLTCLVHAMFELGIEPSFATSTGGGGARVIDLTPDEQDNVRGAMRFLCVRAGGWKSLAPALGFKRSTLVHVKKGEKNVSPTMLLRVAKLAGVPVDDLLAGRFPPAGACAHCGRSA